MKLSTTLGAALGVKPASGLCLEAYTTRVASGPGAFGVPRADPPGQGGVGGTF